MRCWELQSILRAILVSGTGTVSFPRLSKIHKLCLPVLSVRLNKLCEIPLWNLVRKTLNYRLALESVLALAQSIVSWDQLTLGVCGCGWSHSMGGRKVPESSRPGSCLLGLLPRYTRYAAWLTEEGDLRTSVCAVGGVLSHSCRRASSGVIRFLASQLQQNR